MCDGVYTIWGDHVWETAMYCGRSQSDPENDGNRLSCALESENGCYAFESACSHQDYEVEIHNPSNLV